MKGGVRVGMRWGMGWRWGWWGWVEEEDGWGCREWDGDGNGGDRMESGNGYRDEDNGDGMGEGWREGRRWEMGMEVGMGMGWG